MHEICPIHLILLDMNIVMMLVDKYKKRHSSLLSNLLSYLIFLSSSYFPNILSPHRYVSVWATSLGPTRNISNTILIYIRRDIIYMQKKKANVSGPNGCKYSSNLTSYLSITPKYVHFSHFLRIYKYLCSATFSNALLIRLHRHWFPRFILDHSSF